MSSERMDEMNSEATHALRVLLRLTTTLAFSALVALATMAQQPSPSHDAPHTRTPTAASA